MDIGNSTRDKDGPTEIQETFKSNLGLSGITEGSQKNDRN